MRILVLEGDGIGPEIAAATVECLKALDASAKLGLSFDFADIGFAALKKSGTTLPDAVLEKALGADGTILGPVSHADYPPRDKGGLNPSGEIRKRLDLFANVRPSWARPHVPSLAPAIDVTVVRENLEGFYADRNMVAGQGEFMPTEDMALAVRKITRNACRRIAEAAFRIAEGRRKRLVAVHKANVLRLGDGLFLEEVERAAKNHPSVRLEERHIDAMVADIVRAPGDFDTIVTTNMFGDILSNLAAELSGSLGMAASLNAGDAHACAQAAHGSAPELAGRDAANPVGLMLSAAMLLDWLGRRHDRKDIAAAAARFAAAVEAQLATDDRTADLGGGLGTRAFSKAVAARLG